MARPMRHQGRCADQGAAVMTEDGSERRKYQRFQTAADVEIRIEAAPNVPGLLGRIYHCSTSDISLRGVCLVIDDFIPARTELVLLIKLSQLPNRFRHTGKVVWCRPAGDATAEETQVHHAGIEFNMSTDPRFAEWRTELLRLYEDRPP
jgi:PilZ domain